MHMRALVFFLSFSVIATSVWARSSLVSCNGLRPSQHHQSCGEPRPCDEPTMGVCPGTFVDSQPRSQDCTKGSSNEFCAKELGVCTKSYHCRLDATTLKCTFDATRPVLGPDGKQVVSYERIPVAKSCIRSESTMPIVE